MHKSLDLILSNTETILAAFAEHPTAVNQFLLLVCILALFALAWKSKP